MECGLQTSAKWRAGLREENAQITLAILSGQERGAKRDIVLLNAACALVIAGSAEDIRGLSLARASVDTGAAMGKLGE